MSTAPNLRLIKPEENPDVLPLERRYGLRHKANGQVTAVQTFEVDGERRSRICSISLTNMSDTGIGGMCDTELEENASIDLYFPAHGSDPGFATHGNVVRSRTKQGGFDIGIRLAAQIQAA